MFAWILHGRRARGPAVPLPAAAPRAPGRLRRAEPRDRQRAVDHAGRRAHELHVVLRRLARPRGRARAGPSCSWAGSPGRSAAWRRSARSASCCPSRCSSRVLSTPTPGCAPSRPYLLAAAGGILADWILKARSPPPGASGCARCSRADATRTSTSRSQRQPQRRKGRKERPSRRGHASTPHRVRARLALVSSCVLVSVACVDALSSALRDVDAQRRSELRAR